MNRPARRLASGLLALSLLAGACGGDDGDEGASTTTEGEGEGAAPDVGCSTTGEGGDVTVGVYSFTQSLDPTVAASNGLLGASEAAAIYDTLMRYDVETGEFEPRVAESLESNEDFTEWTLKLRSGVTFGNGDPLTADDVKASIERHLAEDSKSTYKSFISVIDTMTVVDDLTVEFVLSDAWPKLPYSLSLGPGMITNPRVVEERGADLVSNPAGAGVGPFEFERFAPNEEVVLKPRDDYWGGPVCPASLRFVAPSSARGNLEALQNGEVDVMISRDSRVIADATDAGLDGIPYVVSSGWLMALNSGGRGGDPATGDLRVRQAIAAAVDVEVVNQRAEDGKGNSTVLVMGPGSNYYQELDGPTYDPDRAKSLVEEVKSDTGWDGSIRMQCSPDPMQGEQALAVQAMLEGVGFDVELTTTATIGDMVTNVVEGNFDISCWGFNVFDANVWGGLKGVGTDDPVNYYGYSEPDMDAALDDLRLAGSQDEERDALAKIQAVWTETVPLLVLGAATNFVGMADGVTGVTPSADTVVHYNQVMGG